jgi:hypothetical protein
MGMGLRHSVQVAGVPEGEQQVGEVAIIIVAEFKSGHRFLFRLLFV